jgi:hypothetical protein
VTSCFQGLDVLDTAKAVSAFRDFEQTKRSLLSLTRWPSKQRFASQKCCTGRAARQIAMYLAHVLLSRPQHDVALLFDRDRTTVAHAMHVVEDRRDDPRLERLIERIERRFERTRTAARRGGNA